jgi:hypothetical protein
MVNDWQSVLAQSASGNPLAGGAAYALAFMLGLIMVLPFVPYSLLAAKAMRRVEAMVAKRWEQKPSPKIPVLEITFWEAVGFAAGRYLLFFLSLVTACVLIRDYLWLLRILASMVPPLILLSWQITRHVPVSKEMAAAWGFLAALDIAAVTLGVAFANWLMWLEGWSFGS